LKETLSYQLPGKTQIKSFEGCWKRISAQEITSLSHGFIFSDFLKERIYHFTPTKELSELPNNCDFTILKEDTKNLTKSDYLSKCTQFIDSCKQGKLSKIVLSRTKDVKLPAGFDINAYFLRLCKNYLHSFNYLVSIPDAGTWIGATPEELLVKNKTNYTTVALAGTRSVDSSIPFTDKEKEEQQLVTEYIEELLKEGNYKFIRDQKPLVVRAGNLLHLKSNFFIEQLNNPLELAFKLHPTPAVCGLPLTESEEIIRIHEGYERNYYTGFLGILNDTDFALYVNLRCAEILSDKIRIYVGGGITALSNAEDEWMETENKSKTLLNII
jgi:isochorismate synthase